MDKIVIKDKRIVDFYNKYKHLNIEHINLMVIDLYENMLEGLPGELNSHISSEILSTIKLQCVELDIFKTELNTLVKNNLDVYKYEIDNIKNLNNLSHNTINSDVTAIKTTLEKLNSEITNNIISKFYDSRIEYNNQLKLLIDKNSSESLIKILEKIEHVHDGIIDKTSIIVSDIIPKSQYEYYNQHNIIIKEFKEDIIKNIDNIKYDIKENKSDISFDKVSNLLNDKYSTMLSSVQTNVQNYISISEDRMKCNIDELKILNSTTQNTQDKLNGELNLFLNQYKNNSSKKGEYGENLLESILSNLFPSSEIINTTGQCGMGDFILQRGEGRVKILFENKNYDSNNVPRRDIEKFIHDCEVQNCSGIIMSQFSGFALKSDFAIDINHGEHVLIYIQNMQNDPDKIMVACNMIDNLTGVLKQLNSESGDRINISKLQLEIINDQYHNFISKRESIISLLNDNNRHAIACIKEMELSEINVMLSTLFASTKIVNLKCEICDNYIGSNNKALTNHKRSCKLKHQQIALPITLISIEEPTTPTVAITTPIPKKKLKK